MSFFGIALPGSQEMAEQCEILGNQGTIVFMSTGAVNTRKTARGAAEVKASEIDVDAILFDDGKATIPPTGEWIRLDVVRLCKCDVVIWPVCCCWRWLCIGNIACCACVKIAKFFLFHIVLSVK